MIYLDHNATSPLRPSVRQALVDELACFGNASSPYADGRDARASLEASRRCIAETVGVEPREVFFTSGGTESNNTALLGVVDAGAAEEVVLAPHDHSSVVAAARELERRGARLRFLPVDSDGRLDLAQTAEAISTSTKLVSLCWANNEIGTVQDVAQVAAICRRREVVFHIDAVQGLGKLGVRLPEADLVSITAHKLGGPKGIGALIRRGDVALRPLLHGGSQERGLRPGTENVAGACGFAAALTAATGQGVWSSDLRERLWTGLSHLPGAFRYSPEKDSLPNTLLAGFAGLRGESIVAALDLEGVEVSVGSACAAGSGEASHVLLALGYGDDDARGGVRFSTGPDTTAEEIDRVVETVAAIVFRMREHHTSSRYVGEAP